MSQTYDATDQSSSIDHVLLVIDVELSEVVDAVRDDDEESPGKGLHELPDKTILMPLDQMRCHEADCGDHLNPPPHGQVTEVPVGIHRERTCML